MNRPAPLQTKSSRIVYENPWIKLREDSIIRTDGSEGVYSVVESADSVMIIAVNDKGEICFINVYRYPLQQWRWELPGGGTDGEGSILASKRELQEETGVEAKSWQALGKTRVCNGLMTEYQTVLLATDLTIHEMANLEDEIAGYKFISLEQIDELIDQGVIDDGQSLAALYMYKKWLSSN